LAKKGQVSAEM